jgi:hypothetical protein
MDDSTVSERALGSRVWFLLAWVLVDAAISVYLLSYGVGTAARLLLLAGIVAFGVVAMRSNAGGSRRIDDLCILVVAAHAAVFLVAPFRAEVPAPSDLYRVFPGITLAVLAIAGAWRGAGRRAGAMNVALGVAVAAGLLCRVAIVATDIDPPFDVWSIQAAAGRALLAGTDPYLTAVYHGGYLYLPLGAMAAAVGELLGDARWANIGGDLLVIVGLVAFARLEGRSYRLGLAVASLYAWWAGGLYVTWQGFLEPILLGWVAVAAVALAGDGPRLRIAGVFVGLAAATKQFGLGLMLFLPRRRGGGWPSLLSAAVTLLIVVLPFVLWHPTQFLEGTLFSLIREPGREYALNLLNWPGISLDPPLIAVFLASIAFGWLCQRRQTSSVTGWLAGSVGLLLGAFALNRIAFVNYFAIPLALMLFLLLARERDGDGAIVSVSASSPR